MADLIVPPSSSVEELLDKPRGRQSAWLPVFMEFLSHVVIDSKEDNRSNIIPYEAQLRFLEEVCDGLDEDIHYFVNLKARQLGISTVMMALDLFWLKMNPGLKGALIAHSYDAIQKFRETVGQMIKNLPPGFRIKIDKDNRQMLTLANGSTLQYLNAGTKKGSGLGRSQSYNFVHATEMSSWGDESGLQALLRALAEKNPARLFIFESTALGFNMFHDMWTDAQDATDQKAFFIGWWAKHDYRLDKNTREFAQWWTSEPYLSDDERIKCALVKHQYGYEVQLEQIAWYRREADKVSAQSMAQEMPWHEEEAFQATGSPYFNLKRVTADMNAIHTAQTRFQGFTYDFGTRFTETICRQVESVGDSDLRVWDMPMPNGRYVIGVDPAYGRDKNKDDGKPDRSVIEVYRAYADRLVQVAEFATDRPEARQLTWVLAHLAGSYRDCMINLEISGPGALVMGEMKHLRELMQAKPEDFAVAKEAAEMGIIGTLNSARWFLWNRVDSMGGGYAWNTKTTSEEKERIYGGFRDEYNSQLIIVRSIPLLEEMTKLVQDGIKIEASGRNKDDRIFASGLANQSWVKWMRAQLMTELRTFERETKAEAEIALKEGKINNWVLADYFKQKQQERANAARQAAEAGY